MQEVRLYKKLVNQKAQCQNCAHYCVISPGERGICRVRENQKGELFALNYGKAVALHIDPIEKKPLFHFLPGSQSLSLATVGCNFKCLNCQNWEISQGFKESEELPGEYLEPAKVVELALKNKLPSISYTYTEPAIFSEYALDIMKIAKKKKLKNVWVSNGFWSEELFESIAPYLDAANIDLKSFQDSFYMKYCGAKLQPVLETLKRLKKKKIWVEIATLIIPTLNDTEQEFQDISGFIKKELGPETPWHVTRFFPDVSWKLQSLPATPIETIKKAQAVGLKAGLKYVHTGNI